MVLPIFTKAAQGGNPADPAADIADQPIQEYLAEKSSQDLVANFADSFKNAHDEGTRRHENELLTGVRMGLLDPSQVNMRVNADGMRQITQAAEKVRKEQSNSTFMFLSLLDQLDQNIAALDAALTDKYGDRFAVDLLSDLHADGLIKDDDYKRIMAIDDPDERRRAIAKHIQQAIDDGRIDPDHPSLDDPILQQWLKEHAERKAAVEREAKSGKPVEEMSMSATRRAHEHEGLFDKSIEDAIEENYKEEFDTGGSDSLKSTSLKGLDLRPIG